jgi:hypothetical protein
VKYFKGIGVTRKPIGKIKSGRLQAGLFGTKCSEVILSILWLGFVALKKRTSCRCGAER